METAKEAGGRHRGRLVLRIVNEEDDFTKFHNDHFENNTVDGMERNQAQSRRSESSSTGTMSDVAVKTARMPGEEHSDRNTAKVETDRFHGDGYHARFPHLVTEAGSIVLHVSNSMNEIKKDGEEAGETAAKETEEISHKDAAQGRETTTERIEQKHQEMYQRQEKSEMTTRNPKNAGRFQRCQQHPRNHTFITKVGNERGEINTSRKGIATVFSEFYKNFTMTMSKTKLNKKSVRKK